MPRADYKTCKVCERHADECGPLSWTRQCGDCGTSALVENIEGIHRHTGPAFRRWRHGIAASVGAVLLDELETKA